MVLFLVRSFKGKVASVLISRSRSLFHSHVVVILEGKDAVQSLLTLGLAAIQVFADDFFWSEGVLIKVPRDHLEDVFKYHGCLTDRLKLELVILRELVLVGRFFEVSGQICLEQEVLLETVDARFALLLAVQIRP